MIVFVTVDLMGAVVITVNSLVVLDMEQTVVEMDFVPRVNVSAMKDGKEKDVSSQTV